MIKEDKFSRLLKPIKEEAELIVCKTLREQLIKALDFLETPSTGALRVSVFNSDIESRYTATLMSLLQSLASERGFPFYTLMTTAKHARKKKIFQEVKARFEDQSLFGVILVENFEEWDGNLLSDLIEFLIERSDLDVGLIVELPGDLSKLKLALRFDIAQQIILETQQIPQFSIEADNLLYKYTKNPSLPLLSRELFAELRQTKTKEDFFPC